jgi:hypothetical protein
MSSREDLIGGAERYLRRKLTDGEVQQLIHASDSYRFGNNDALWLIISMLEANKWSLGETLESYRGEFAAIPQQIKQAADAERESLKAAGQLAATQVQAQITETVKSLVPTVKEEVGRAASSTIRRIKLGEGMISIGAGALITSFLMIVGIALGTGVYHNMILYPKQPNVYWTQIGWAVEIAIAAPMLIGLGIYALVADYNSETKFAGWALIAFSIAAFVFPALKVMGWWK